MPKGETGSRPLRGWGRDRVCAGKRGIVADSGWRANHDDPDEHRRYPRLECGGVADIRVLPNGGKERGTLLNLSKRGCCFMGNDRLRGCSGSNIEVHLKVRGIDLRVAGVIRHVRQGMRAGIEFVELSERKRDQIEELIGELTILDKKAAQGHVEARKLHEQEYLSKDLHGERRRGPELPLEKR
jgi:hypothetical protein